MTTLTVPASLPASTARRGDLDLLRVLAILLLHVFHTGMMFNSWDWHVKSPVVLSALEPPMVISHLVRMPLLMLIAGMATAFALRRRSLGTFTKDRVLRLFVPLVFGMLVIIPPQIYVERLFRGEFAGSYLDFYPSVFAFEPYPRGSFSWHHLWFVAYLFVYCLALVPVAALLRTEVGGRVLRGAERFLTAGRGLGLLAIPVLLATLRRVFAEYGETHALIDDPNTLTYYGALFLTGHLMARMPAVWDTLVALRRWLLALCIGVLAVMLPPWEYPQPFEAFGRQLFVWSFLLTCLAFARAHVSARPRWLVHAQDLAYPFYFFHQTVIIVVGYLLLRSSFSGWSLFGVVLVSSFAVTWGLCELCGRIPVLRGLVGFAPRARTEPAAVSARAAAAEPA